MKALRTLGMLGLATVVLFSGAPAPAAANHGVHALYTSNDGTEVKEGVWITGGGNAQTWAFVGTRGACLAVGSIEVGFGDCAGVSGTGHFHPADIVVPDEHDVLVNGKPGHVSVL